MADTLDTDTLRRVGAALYGAQWQSPLARDLGVTDRTMRRWLAGEHPVASDVGDSLLALVTERGNRLKSLVSELSKKNAVARKKALAD